MFDNSNVRRSCFKIPQIFRSWKAFTCTSTALNQTIGQSIQSTPTKGNSGEKYEAKGRTIQKPRTSRVLRVKHRKTKDQSRLIPEGGRSTMTRTIKHKSNAYRMSKPACGDGILKCQGGNLRQCRPVSRTNAPMGFLNHLEIGLFLNSSIILRPYTQI